MGERIISAEEARELREAATQGDWYSPRGAGCLDVRVRHGQHRQSRGPAIAFTCGLLNESEDRANARLLAAAPDLAHTVEALTAERDALAARVARLERVVAVEWGDESQAPDGWHLFESGWWVRQGASVERDAGGWTWRVQNAECVPARNAIEAMEAANKALGAPHA